MSTRTDWGLFDKAGAPLAVGDAWHRWTCPQQKWEATAYEHPITGEMVDQEPAPVPCPFKNVTPKLDRCSACGMEFRYP